MMRHLLRQEIVLNLVLQFVLSLALLALVFSVRSTNGDAFNLVLGAIITHWFHESSATGRTIASSNGHATDTVVVLPPEDKTT